MESSDNNSDNLGGSWVNRIRLQVIIYFGLVLVATTSVFSQQMPENLVSFSIQFYDQKIYYQGDDITIKATVTNNSPTAYRFRLADNRMFSLSFDIRDLANMALKPSEKYTTVLSENKPVFARDLTILPGEDFSFTEQLAAYKELPSGVFVLAAQFYPEMLGQTGQAILQSNNLTLSIRPAVRKQNMIQETVDLQVQQILRAENLPPDQVVAYMLTARQQDKAEAYFLYLDLNQLYKNEPRRGEALRRMSESEHMEALNGFKADLWKTTITDTISLKPTSYEIMKTSYSGKRGTVEVLLKYKNNFFTEIKEFKYQLERQQDIWKIVSYSVTNKGNE